MHRIDGAGHVDHQFVAEDVDALRAPTEVTDAWLNAVQEELVAAIELSGDPLDKSNNRQLAKLIDSALPEIGNYEALRAYAGTASRARIYGREHIFDMAHGIIRRDDGDVASIDNDGTVFVDALGRRWKREDVSSVLPEWFGGRAVPGVDATDGIVKAFDFANSFVKASQYASIKLPGARVILADGKYNLETLSGPIDIWCDVDSRATDFQVFAGYADVVLRVGLSEPGVALHGAEIRLPGVIKTNNTLIAPDSVAIRLLNIAESRIYCRRTWFFEVGVWAGGIGEGTVACDIWLPNTLYCKISWMLKPGAGGWCNANRFHGGHIQQSPGYTGGHRVPGWRHIVMDGSAPATSVVANTFIGCSLEGYASEYLVEARWAYGNTFVGVHHESGFPLQPVVIDSALIRQPEHGRAVGDMITFQATATPTGMVLAVPYYIVEVPDADSFRVSIDKAGLPVTFASAGADVTYIVSMRCLFDGTGGSHVVDNKFINTLTPPSIFIDYIETGTAASNGNDSSRTLVRQAYVPEDTPMFRARNRAVGAATRPCFAAYAPNTNPDTDPTSWLVALSDRGVLFKSSGAEVGRIFNVSGIISYQRPSDAVAYEIASCRRAPSLLSVIGLVVPANGQASTVLTLTGASQYDLPTITPTAMMPAGISISYCFVSGSNAITVVFANSTAAAVTLSATLNLMATRRFY